MYAMSWVGFAFILAPVIAADAAETGKAPVCPIERAIKEGRPWFGMRYRYENVDQEGFSQNAEAHTLRTIVGYQSGKANDFSMLVEFEDITSLGGARFNDTVNGRISYPVVADPEDSTLNRFSLSFAGIPQTEITLGRQLIALDNQRFVGSVGWRQNDQTFDALTVKNQSIGNMALFYTYASRVNRIFGNNSSVGTWDHGQIHLVNASYTPFPNGRISGFSYLLDLPDAVTLSTATSGGRFETKHALHEKWTGFLNLDYAHQTDYANNPRDLNFDYYSAELGVTSGAWTVKGLYEAIEGDGMHAMQFPLGSNHAFDGWVDKFLTTPPNGLIDKAMSVTYVARSENARLNGAKATLVFHDFSAEHGVAVDYGREWDLLVEQSFGKHCIAGMKFGYYDANALFTGTKKIMPYLQVNF